MLDNLKQKISTQFSKNELHQACDLYNLIQLHINNMGLEGEEIARIIIIYLHNENFLEFRSSLFSADEFIIK